MGTRTYDRFGGFNSPDFDFLGEADNFGLNAWEQVDAGYDGRLGAELGKISKFDRERAVEALGIKAVNSGSDLKQIREYLGGGGGGGGNGAGGGAGGPSDRGTGDYGDIIGSLQDDIAAANQRAEDFANQQAQGIADNTAMLTAQFDERLAALTAGFTERYGALESMFEKQNSSMQQFQQMMQQNMQQAQQSYNQQVQMMQNMQSARIPGAETNAATAQIGDQREDQSRDKENNRLSDLSILSGLGTSSNPTSGLSLA